MQSLALLAGDVGRALGRHVSSLLPAVLAHGRLSPLALLAGDVGRALGRHVSSLLPAVLAHGRLSPLAPLLVCA